jgi:two-component system, LuxR family, sensor kinase FixL
MRFSKSARRAVGLPETGSDTDGIGCYNLSLMSPENGFDTREAIGLDEWEAMLGLLEASGTALIGVDSALEVTLWSPAGEVIFGWKTEEIVGCGISLLAPKGEFERSLTRLDNTQARDFECSCRTKGGKTILVNVWASPLAAGTGRRLLMIRDVSELRFLERAFLSAAEREQQRIGREMHDYLCQHLLGAAFAVKALAGDLDREGSRHADQLHQLARLVNEAVTQVRDISRGLNPVELESGGLPAALQGLAARVSRSVPCEFHCEKNAPVGNSDPALHAYRVAQEAVAHALQETGATKISIHLSGKSGSIRMEIADDGMKEGSLTADPNSFGSKALHYRAQAIHGQLRAKFQGGIGTHITCTFPCAS